MNKLSSLRYPPHSELTKSEIVMMLSHNANVVNQRTVFSFGQVPVVDPTCTHDRH